MQWRITSRSARRVSLGEGSLSPAQFLPAVRRYGALQQSNACCRRPGRRLSDRGGLFPVVQHPVFPSDDLQSRDPGRVQQNLDQTGWRVITPSRFPFVPGSAG